MKLYIIGPAGSGKTTLSNKISRILNIVATNLDDIFWENNTMSFNNKRDEKIRNNLYNEILNKKSWIIEGAYISWPAKGFNLADKLIYLNINNITLNKRILIRFIKRKLRIENSRKKESLKQVIDLIKWNKQQNLLMREKFINNKENYTNLIILSNKKNIKAFMNNLKPQNY